MTTAKLKLAPFKVGQSVEYIGQRHVTTANNEGVQVPLIVKGMIAEIVETHKPEKGYGFIKFDDDGEAIIDHDRDGYNVFENSFGQRRIIWPDTKNQWRVI